jgi:hypothetical protein
VVVLVFDNLMEVYFSIDRFGVIVDFSLLVETGVVDRELSLL